MSRLCVLQVLLILFYSARAVLGQSQYVQIGSTPIRQPGFSNVYEHPQWIDPTERYSILLSTFSAIPFTRDTSYIMLYVGQGLDNLTAFVPTPLYDDFTWPREISQTPIEVFGFETITQPDGFLPPGKNNGSVFVIDVRNFSNPVTYDIARDPADERLWFYHGVTWMDANLDGREDALTCRVRTVNDTEETEMLWFEHPVGDPFAVQWEGHLINENICDTFQAGWTFDIAGEGPIYALFTVGYFTQTFAVHWSTDPAGSWADPAFIQTYVIHTGHQFFDLQITDVNNDGRLDILVTWNAEVNGSFVAYEIPDDFRSGVYPLHILAEGFVSRSGLNGGGTPGSGVSYYPTSDESGKPWILLSGDDDGRTYYLTPVSQQPLDWSYNLIPIHDEGERNIMGTPSAADVDGDGNKEVFIPAYHAGAVYAYSYTP